MNTIKAIGIGILNFLKAMFNAFKKFKSSKSKKEEVECKNKKLIEKPKSKKKK